MHYDNIINVSEEDTDKRSSLSTYRLFIIWDTLRDLVSFVQFKIREKHPWRSVTFSNKSNTLPWVVFIFFKSHKWYQIAQSVSYDK